MGEIDAIEEIRITMFWRNTLGEMEYAGYDPENLRRWYQALELRGPQDIRAYIIEREGRHGRQFLHGIGPAPHPPMALVELWLATYETKVRLAPVWWGMAGFTILSLIVMSNLNSCQPVSTLNRLALHPPQTASPVQVGSPPSGPPPATSSQPIQMIPPASTSTQSGSQPGH